MVFSTLDTIITVCFLLITLLVGMAFTKKGSQNIESFFLGGRNLPWWVAGTSMVATTFAADTPLLVTELVATKGISGNWLWWNGLIGGMLATFFFAHYWRRANIITDIELIEKRYSGKEAAFLRGFKAVYLGILMNSVVIAWVNVALGSILHVFFAIPEQEVIYYVAAAMVLVVVYSGSSGMLGVAVTDTLQFIVAMTGCIVLAVMVISSEKIGGMVGLAYKLSPESLSFFPTIDFSANPVESAQNLSIGIASFFAFIGIQWWASWYPGAEPGGGGYIAQRMMSAKTEEDAFRSTLFFQIAHYALRPWPWIVVGLATVVLYPDLENKKLGYVMAMKEFLPSGMRGLLFAAFLAAYMSTISTQLNWGASYIINDLYKRFLAPEASEQKLVKASRINTALLMIISLVVTTWISSMEQAFLFMIECGAGLGAVLILRWYWWRINAWSEITATFVPFITYPIAVWGLDLKFPESLFFTTSITTVVWVLITLLTPPTEKSVLQKFYAQIQPDGFWKPIAHSLSMPSRPSYLPLLLLCWGFGVLMGYSFLFGIGYALFFSWIKMGICLFFFLLSVFVINILLKKISNR